MFLHCLQTIDMFIKANCWYDEVAKKSVLKLSYYLAGNLTVFCKHDSWFCKLIMTLARCIKSLIFYIFVIYISLKLATFWPCLKTGQTFSKTFKNQLLNAFQLGNDKKKSKKIQCINARRTISNELKHWKELLEFMKVEHKMSWTLNFNTSKNLANSLNWTRCFPSCYNNHSI